jgi:succinate dehydrogenase/fumarate reductase-like Fe-S protein
MNYEPVVLRIFRYDPDSDRAPRYELHHVPWTEGLLLLGALKYIRENIDPTLAFRGYCCGCSWCGSCLMTVNGKGIRTCSQPLKPGENLLVEPMRGFPIIRDLAVDFGVIVATAQGSFSKMAGTVLRKECNRS